MTCQDRTACTPLLRLLVATIAILTVGSGSSFAAPTASAAIGQSQPRAPLSSAEEEWEEEAGEWEVEDDEEEWEVEEGSEAAGTSDSSWEVSVEGERGKASEPCTPYRANARVVAAERRDTVLLRVDYAWKQAKRVRIKYWLKGSRGALQLAPLRQRTSRGGGLRGVERLNAKKMAKVRAARAFVVDLEMAGTPSYCDRYSMRHLTARQRRGDRVVWSEPARSLHGPS